ncbi:class III lanthipeptide [Streptomyces ficellus]|uniref:Class III lanthipeptide n=1 Tax=Streptomyces ficellus TaxID=1977088 RepID=A0ABT7YZU0_9ACTN|nr:class III lanthipeptide [Streptomyces ficellus]MDN3292760.1 class III lanthipeptide [Streptomyces ficellus]
MTILDLQGMDLRDSAAPPPGSRASKQCGGASRYSLLLC